MSGFSLIQFVISLEVCSEAGYFKSKKCLPNLLKRGRSGIALLAESNISAWQKYSSFNRSTFIRRLVTVSQSYRIVEELGIGKFVFGNQISKIKSSVGFDLIVRNPGDGYASVPSMARTATVVIT